MDDALIKMHSETQVVEMLNGCVCCTGAALALGLISETLVSFD